MLPTPTNLESVNRCVSRGFEYGDFLNRPFAVNRSSFRYGSLELLLQFVVRTTCVRILVTCKNYEGNPCELAQTQPPHTVRLLERI
jgi:hypothetical protein